MALEDLDHGQARVLTKLRGKKEAPECLDVQCPWEFPLLPLESGKHCGLRTSTCSRRPKNDKEHFTATSDLL